MKLHSLSFYIYIYVYIFEKNSTSFRDRLILLGLIETGNSVSGGKVNARPRSKTWDFSNGSINFLPTFILCRIFRKPCFLQASFSGDIFSVQRNKNNLPRKTLMTKEQKNVTDSLYCLGPQLKKLSL